MADVQAIVAGVRKAVGATRSMDEATRRASEAQFRQMSLQQYPRLIYALGEIMRDNSIPLDDPDRQQASVLLAGFIKPRDPNQHEVYAKLWMGQTASFKVQVKKQLMEAMGAPGHAGAGLARSASACLAEIAVLEIPRKMWPSFAVEVQKLAHTQETNEGSFALRKSTCIVIGQVCATLAAEHFSRQDVDVLLTSLRACMNSRSPDVVAAAMDGLTSSLKFIASFLEVDAQRNGLVGELVQKGVKSPSAAVQEKALQCLVVMCDDYYRYMGGYFKGIMELTIGILKNPKSADEVKIQAIEVWNTILEVELDIQEGNLNLMKQCGLVLVPILMQAMIFRSEDIAESDDNVPERSARTTLQLLASLLRSKEMLSKVMGIAGKCISQPPTQWAHREMGFIAIGLTMDVAEDPATAAAIGPYIVPCVTAIVQATTAAGEKRATRDSALWALERILVYALDQFPQAAAAHKTLKHVLDIVEKSPEPLLVMRATTCVRSYHKFFKHCPPAQRLNLIRKFCPPNVHRGVLQSMVKAASARRSQLSENNLGQNIFDCLQKIIAVPDLVYDDANAEANKPYYEAMHKAYNHFAQQLGLVLKDQSMSAEVRNILIAGYCSSASACLLAFDRDLYRNAIIGFSKSATDSLLQHCFDIQKMPNAASIQEEALMVTARVVSILGKRASPYVGKILKNMKAVIDAKASEDETKLAIGLISEVYTFGWEAPQQAHDQIMQLLVGLMRDSHLSRNTKPLILEAMTCMLATLQKGFMKYMNAVLTMLAPAMVVEKPVGDLSEEDEDKATFVDKLRMEILLFISELMQIPESAPTFANPNFQRALGKFLLTLMQPGQATDEQVDIIRAVLQDLNRQNTQQLYNTLVAQPAVRPYL